MADHWKKLIALGFLLLVGLWAAGVVRSFGMAHSDLPALSVSIPSSVEDYRGSLRTANNLAQIGLVKAPLPKVLDQEDIQQIRVYEKTAQISAGSTAFADDEARIRKALADHQAVVFSEKATGISPERSLALGISVRPDKFDALLHALTEIGQVGAITVQQHDRTTEFRRLHAQRQSLKKYQEAILKLRASDKLTVEEALKLEQKIQEIEKELQTLGVQLGDLLGKEPSYNLFVTLQEYQPGSRYDRGFTFTRRLGSGLYWAAGWWFVAAAGAGVLIGVYLSVRTLRSGARQAAGTPGVVRG
jgi:hypothetical protein